MAPVDHELARRLSNELMNAEIALDNTLTDIVEDRFSAGIRLGEAVDKDMIAVRIGPDLRFAVVGTPSYLKNRAAPQTPQDLVEHSCINLRLPTHGDLMHGSSGEGAWFLRVRALSAIACEAEYALRALTPLPQAAGLSGER